MNRRDARNTVAGMPSGRTTADAAASGEPSEHGPGPDAAGLSGSWWRLCGDRLAGSVSMGDVVYLGQDEARVLHGVGATRVQSVSKVEIAKRSIRARARASATDASTPTADCGIGPAIFSARHAPAACTPAGTHPFAVTIESSSGVRMINQNGPTVVRAGSSPSGANRHKAQVPESPPGRVSSPLPTAPMPRHRGVSLILDKNRGFRDDSPVPQC